MYLNVCFTVSWLALAGHLKNIYKRRNKLGQTFWLELKLKAFFLLEVFISGLTVNAEAFGSGLRAKA